MNDIADVTQLILHERQGRDRGWWVQMNSAFLQDSTVKLSWFDGSGPDFVAASENMSGRGDRSVHRMAAPVVHVVEDRGYVEVATAVEFQITLSGTAADLISYTRLNYRVKRETGRWGIFSLDGIYERDTLTSSLPGQTVTIDPVKLEKFRSSYSLIAYYLETRGYIVCSDLLGDDQPEKVTAFYDGVKEWLHQ